MALAARSKGYLIDACTLLNWVAILIGKEPEHAAFREWVWAAFQQGLFKISKTVEEEILRHSSRLSAAIAKRDVEIITPCEELVAKAKAMREDFIKQGRIVGKKCVSANDLLFILIAKRLGMTVVTDEASGKGCFNIPAACDYLDVPYLSSARLLLQLRPAERDRL